MFASIVDALEHWADTAPNKDAFIFLSDRGVVETRLTFWELHRRALELSRQLADRSSEPGDRALLVFPPGLEFLVSFFGCLLARVIAVPMLPPRRTGLRDASSAIISDCEPRFALTSNRFASAIRVDIDARSPTRKFEWLTINGAGDLSAFDGERLAPVESGDIALLQYTSGSTSTPKGVMVTHANLGENLEMIKRAFGNTQSSTYVSWLPLHHDMGLVLNTLQSLYVGATCVLMSPTSFLQRPFAWLRAISDYKADVAGGPNFAFDHCVARFRPEQMQAIDLSSWRVAFNGAEPVRAETLQRFASTFSPYGFQPSALYPCYGMAEATLLISGGTPGNGPVIQEVSQTAMQSSEIASPASNSDTYRAVGCGQTLVNEHIAIVDLDGQKRLDVGRIGEIWVCGPHIARGYWRKPDTTRDTFEASIPGETAQGQWLRTGDLGFMNAAGELFITGRIKDVIIVRGVNHYPQDIEYTVQAASDCFRKGHGAAFSVLDPSGAERLVVVQEIERTQRHTMDPDELCATAREAVAEEHDLSLHKIILLKPGSLPKTTSGKIQRRLTRSMWQAGHFADAMIDDSTAESGLLPATTKAL